MARNRPALAGMAKFTRRLISKYRALASPAVSSPAGVVETGMVDIALEAILTRKWTTLASVHAFLAVLLFWHST